MATDRYIICIHHNEHMMLCMQCLFTSHSVHSYLYSQALCLCSSWLPVWLPVFHPVPVCVPAMQSPASSFQLVPSPSPSEVAAAKGEQKQVRVAYSMFNDIHTGAPISAARVEEINARIAQVLAGIKKGKEIYHLTLENGGSLQEAEKASNEAAGGRMTKLFDNLCNEHILVNMMVKLPPARDKKQMYQNEEKLSMQIHCCDIFMSTSKVEIWTSRQEIGQAQETTAYVRWPYYLAIHVQTLCAKLRPIMIGTHALNCELVFSARAHLQRVVAAPEQWEAIIGDHRLPQLTGEAWEDYQAMRTKSWSERVLPQIEAMAAAVMLYDDAAFAQDVQDHLWPTEIETLEESVSFTYSKMLKSPNKKDNAWAYFKIAGLIMEEAKKGTNPDHLVQCYGVKSPLLFEPDAPRSLFLDHTPGYTYMTLDKPFPIYMQQFVMKNGTKVL